MADGCLLLVDAKDGPMPQTRFVLKKALEMGHKIIVVINKIDKEGARPDFALNATSNLFLELGAGDRVLNFPVLYASGRDGKAGSEPDLNKMENIIPIFDAIITHIPSPLGDPKKPLQMLVTSISGDEFKGRCAIGRVYNGTMKAGQEIMHIKLVVAAARKFLGQGGNSPTLLQEAIGEVFGEEIPPGAGNDVLTLCRQAALAVNSLAAKS
jgi:GTP-binding protein